MTLRRFPWKCPKDSDNSFRLFITQPTEDELHSALYPTVRSHAVSEPTSRATSAHQNQQPSNNSEPSPTTEASPNKDSPSVKSSTTTVSASTANTSQVIKGPWRLLRLLPRETRFIVGSMLDTDPTKRASLEQVLKDPWIAKTAHCKQEVGGKVMSAEGHEHVLAASDGEPQS
jgi:hypothetical protein